MLSLKFFKGLPTDYVIKYVKGRLVAEGVGLSFSYFRQNTRIVVLPVSSRDGEVTFTTVTSDLQAVEVRVQFLYRIIDAHQAASQFDFSIDTNRKSRVHLSRDIGKLTQCAADLVQNAMTEQVQRHTLKNLHDSFNDIAQEVQNHVNLAPAIKTLGIEMLSVFLISACPRTDIKIMGGANTSPETTTISTTASASAMPAKSQSDITELEKDAPDLPPQSEHGAQGPVLEQHSSRLSADAPNANALNTDSSTRTTAAPGGRSGGDYLFVATAAAQKAKRQAEENRRRRSPRQPNVAKSPNAAKVVVAVSAPPSTNHNEQPTENAV